MNSSYATVPGGNPSLSFGLEEVPMGNAPGRVTGLMLKPGTHIRGQRITTSAPVDSLGPIYARPQLMHELASLVAPMPIDMLTADDERDLHYPAVPVDYNLAVPPAMKSAPVPEMALYRGEFQSVDIKAPLDGTFEAREKAAGCTGEGYPKCPYCPRPIQFPAPSGGSGVPGAPTSLRGPP